MKDRLRVGVALVVAVVTVGSLACMAEAQEAKSGTPPTEGKKSSEAPYAAAQARLTELQKSIESSVEMLKNASKPDSERLKDLDKFLASLKDVNEEFGENSDLLKLVVDGVQKNEAQQAKYKGKAGDPNLKPQIREGYEKLAAIFQKNVAGLIDAKLTLGKQADWLKENVTLIEQNRDMVADYVQAEQYSLASEEIKNVVNKAIELNANLEKITSDIGETLGAPQGSGETTPGR